MGTFILPRPSCQLHKALIFWTICQRYNYMWKFGFLWYLCRTQYLSEIRLWYLSLAELRSSSMILKHHRSFLLWQVLMKSFLKSEQILIELKHISHISQAYISWCIQLHQRGGELTKFLALEWRGKSNLNGGSFYLHSLAQFREEERHKNFIPQGANKLLYIFV